MEKPTIGELEKRERQYWEDREKIRLDPTQRFRDEEGLQCLMSFPLKSPLLTEIQNENGFRSFRILLIHDLFLRRFAQVLFSASKKALRDFVNKGFSSTPEALALQDVFLDRDGAWDLEKLLKMLRLSLSLGLEDSSQEIFEAIEEQVQENPEKFTPSEKSGHNQHYTEDQRQVAGAMALHEMLESSDKASQEKRAVFLGGSTGLTAHLFRTMFPSSVRDRWTVDCLDLLSPTEIFAQWKEAGRTISDVYFEGFRGFEDVNYVQGDLRNPPFSEESYDVIDMCSCTGYLSSINDRLESITKAWKLLKVGGFFRTTCATGGDSLFQDLILQKMGHGSSDWEIRYINIVGFAYSHLNDSLEDPKVAFSYGKTLTQNVMHLRNRIREENWKPETQETFPWGSVSAEEALLNDLRVLSPLTFGAGIPTDLSICFGPSLDTCDQIKAFLEQTLSSAEKFLA